jgi:hypothetical protein
MVFARLFIRCRSFDSFHLFRRAHAMILRGKFVSVNPR